MLDVIHDYIVGLFPIWTDSYVMHIVVMGILTPLFYYAGKRSRRFAVEHIFILSYIIEIDQLVFKTGTFDIFDILAGIDGCLMALVLIMLIERESMLNGEFY